MTARAFHILLIMALGVGLVVITFFAPRATAATPALDEPGPGPRQLVICRPGEECEKRGKPVGKTACDVDAAAERLLRTLPKATRIGCAQVAE